MRALARRTTLIEFPRAESNGQAWQTVIADAHRALRNENLLAVTAAGTANAEVEKWWPYLLSTSPSNGEPPVSAPIVPVFCGPLHPDAADEHDKRVRVVFGHPVPATTSLHDIRASIHRLADWIRDAEVNGHLPVNAVIPGASDASLKEMVSSHQPHP
jgi:hypothetical protein